MELEMINESDFFFEYAYFPVALWSTQRFENGTKNLMISQPEVIWCWDWNIVGL